MGTPPSGALNARGVANYIERCHVLVSHLVMSFLSMTPERKRLDKASHAAKTAKC